MKNFEGFGLSSELNRSLSKMGYQTPTPVQEKAIPLALQGHDILGSAQTGTGKTAAFSIPLVEALLRSPNGCALVLTPTRELAKQVLDVIHQLLGPKSPIKTAFIIGGESMGKQNSQLRQRPRIIVGTPGRINDHLERGSIKLNNTGFLVLDETDRMLDMGFGVQLDRIIKYLPAKRQTLMFSATLPKGIVELSGKYLINPKRVSVGETNVVATNIKQDFIRIEQAEKYQELMVQLHARQGSVIIFAKTKHNADKMSKNLRRDGFTSEALHGDLRQNKRDKVMLNFRNKNFRILVATDIAARGLDVPHIEHVINYDLPQVAEDYIHRMGRTARAGAQGQALSFISNQDSRKWRAIELLLNPDAKDDRKHQGSGKGSKKPRRNRPFKNAERSRDNGDERYAQRKPFKSAERKRDNGGDERNTQRKPFKNAERSKDNSDERYAQRKPFKSAERKRDNGDEERNAQRKPFKNAERSKDNGDERNTRRKPFKNAERKKDNGGDERNTQNKPYRSRSTGPNSARPDSARPNKKRFRKKPGQKIAA